MNNGKDYPKRDIKMILSPVLLKEILHLGIQAKNYRQHLKVSKNPKEPLKIGDIIHLKDQWDNILWTCRDDKLILDITRDSKLEKIEFYF